MILTKFGPTESTISITTKTQQISNGMSLIFRRRCQEQMCYSVHDGQCASLSLISLEYRFQSLGHHMSPHSPVDIVLCSKRCDILCFLAEYPLSCLSVECIGDILQWHFHLKYQLLVGPIHSMVSQKSYYYNVPISEVRECWPSRQHGVS